MGTNIDLKKKFQEYFYELEGFSLRSERFFDEFKFESAQEQKIIKWLEAAYRQGACDMAQDTVDTLGDYAAAVAGLKSEMVTPDQVYDKARSSLIAYYNDVLDETEDTTNKNKTDIVSIKLTPLVVERDVKYLLSCLDKFPRVKSNVETMWGTQAGRKYIFDLVIDNRDRGIARVAGFSSDVIESISALLELHDEIFPKLKPKPGIWDEYI